MLRGGYPEIALDPAADRQLWFAGYVQSYLERDVRDLLQVGDLAAFSRFIALVAARSGGILDVAEVARDAGISTPTVRRCLSVLEASHVVFVLRPHHRNFGKRLIKSPKLYLLDPELPARPAHARGDQLYAMEIKPTATPTPAHAGSLARWLELAPRAALACRVDAPATLRPGIRAVPWHLAW